MPHAPCAVLWDLDGTLVDSEQLHWQAWQDVLKPLGVPITYQQFKSSFGQRNASILPQWLGAGATAEQIEQISDRKEARYRELVRRQRLEGLPGAIAWVQRMRQRGWLQAIASSAPRANVEVMLEALGIADHFQGMVSSEDVRHGKPDPQVFLVAAERLGVAVERCVVVEDAIPGVEGARRAGMRCIGVTGGGRRLGSDLDVDRLSDLPPDAFEKLLER